MTKALPPDASPLAKAIHSRMLAARLNQKSLALLAGLEPTYVRAIFRGDSVSPGVAKLEKLAKALGCSIGDLLPSHARVEPRLLAANLDDKLKVDIPKHGEVVNDPGELQLLHIWRRLKRDELRTLAFSILVNMADFSTAETGQKNNVGGNH